MKPILFNAAMVQAILEGRKTVTRRAIKPQPAGELRLMGRGSCWPGCFEASGEERIYRPPYQPGDILYVRETFRVDSLSYELGRCRVQYKDGTYMDIRFNTERYEMMHRAQRKPGWRPNENMPREAARIFLRVTAVRAARLQEIEKEDVLREGVEPKYYAGGCKCAWAFEGCLEKPCANRDGYIDLCHWMPFSELWDKTMKPADRTTYGWEANPWVWVIEFERISREEPEKRMRG